MKLLRLTTRCTPALLAVVWALRWAVPCQAAGTGERVPIAPGQVSAALGAAGLSIEGAAVQMQVRMSSASAAPLLAVRAVEPWGERRARVRVACVDHAECVPFYVAVEWADAASAQAALASAPTLSGAPARSLLAARSKPPMTQPLQPAPAAAARAATQQPTRAGNPAPAPRPAAGSGGVHPGAHATLRLEGPRIHIEVPVICLEAGAPGQSIRAAAADHKQNYVAEVVDPTLLKGTL